MSLRKLKCHLLQHYCPIHKVQFLSEPEGNGHGHDFGHEFASESVSEADSDTGSDTHMSENLGLGQ